PREPLPTGPAFSRLLKAAYAEPIDPRAPPLRVLRAVIARARDRRIPVLVNLTPVPIRLLRDHGMYDPETLASAAETMGSAVTEEGGRFLDLHDLIDDTAIDFYAHYGGVDVDHVVA